MNYKQAKSKSRVKKLVGVAVFLTATISTAISLLKLIYFRLDDGSELGGMLARPVQSIVYWIYENTQYFSFFWNNSPTPNPFDYTLIDNVYFLIIYILPFIGLALYSSGKKLTIRLKKINIKIENQLIEESLKGDSGRTRNELESAVSIPKQTIWSQFHTLYLAPILVGLFIAIILKIIGI